jgi:HEAT repeat protein
MLAACALTMDVVAGGASALAEVAAPPELVARALEAYATEADGRFPTQYREASERKRSSIEALRALSPERALEAATVLELSLRPPARGKHASSGHERRSADTRVSAARLTAALGQTLASIASVGRPAGGIPESGAGASLVRRIADDLAENLRQPEFELRLESARALAQVPAAPGGGASRASSAFDASVAELARELGARSERTRLSAALTLSILGERAATAAPRLLAALSDEAEEVRVAAIQALGSMSATREDSAVKLLGLARDSSTLVREQALQALGRLARPSDAVFDALLAALRERDPGSRQSARQAFAMLRERASPAVPRITALLGDADSSVRSDAAATLASIGPTAKASQPALIAALAASDAELQANVAWALSAFAQPQPGTPPPAPGEPSSRDAAITALGELLESRDPLARRAGALALARLGSRASSFVARLSRQLGDRDAEARAAAAQALADLGPISKDRLPEIFRWLDSSDPVERKLAAGIAGRAGGLAKGAVPGLLKMAKDPDAELRLAAYSALAQLREAEGLPILRAELAASAASPKARASLLGTLASYGAAGRAALPEVLAALGDADPSVREAALGAISVVGAESEEGARKVAALLSDEAPEVASRAVAALGTMGQLGAAANAAVAPSLALARDARADEARRVRGLQALCRLEARARGAVPELARLLGDSKRKVAAYSAFALRIIGGAPPEVAAKVDAILKADRELFRSIDF